MLSSTYNPSLSRRFFLLFAVCTMLHLVTCGGCGFMRERPVESSEEEAVKPNPRELIALDPGGGYFQTWEMEGGRVISFVIAVPDDYNANTAKPLVIALHFGMARQQQFMGREMLSRMVQPMTSDIKPIIVAPDYINTSWTNKECEEAVMALANKICETYNIDRDRILLMGYSTGATGVWHLAGRYPDFFTAAIALAGRPTSDILEMDWKVPMLVIHSRDDEVFPFSEVSEAVQEMQARVGGIVQLYELDGISHYESAKFFEPAKEAVTWVQEVWNTNAASNNAEGQENQDASDGG
ncbi:MAG: dienelactone hydrolase family protein [Pirellulaceae bacterium]